MDTSESQSDETFEAPVGVTWRSFQSPRVSWKFAHQFPPPGELTSDSATTGYIVLWEGEGRDEEWLDAQWEQIWNTWENDDLWEDGFGDGFILQESLVEWDGPAPALEVLEKMAGENLVAPIRFDGRDWDHVHTHEHVDMGIWTIGEGLFVEVAGERCLISVVNMIRDANGSISVSIGSVDTVDEGDRCVGVVVPYDRFRDAYQRAVPARLEAKRGESDPSIEAPLWFY